MLSVPKDVVYSDLGDEIVALNLRSGKYFGLEGIGARVWLLVNEHRRVEPVVEALMNEYDVAESRLQADITHYLEELIENELLQVDEP